MDTDIPETSYAYHYKKFFDVSDRNFENMAQYYVRWLEYVGAPQPDQKVLEIGCGWGFALAGLRKLGVAHVDAFDIDSFAVGMCRRRGFEVTLLDVEDIHDFMASKAETYDVILAVDVVEHIPIDAQPQALRDIFLALKPGGKFVCQVPNADSIVASHMRYVDYTHHSAFTQVSLDAVLHNAGFAPAEIRDAEPPQHRPSIRHWNDLKNWLLRRIVRKLARAILVAELGPHHGYRTPLDKNIIAIAKRPGG